MSFRIYKLGELGEVSFGMLKLGELGEVTFGKYKLGELDKVSFGILNTTVSISIWIFLPLEKRHLAYKIVIKIKRYLLYQ